MSIANNNNIFSCLGLVAVFMVSMPTQAQNVPGSKVRSTANAAPLPTPYTNGVVNYVRIYEPSFKSTDTNLVINQSATIAKVKVKTDYSDGLGTPIQTVIKGGSTGGHDIVNPILIDNLGRNTLEYLPYASLDGTGNFKMNPFGEQEYFYKNNLSVSGASENIYYSENEYENSPLGRVLKKYSSGNSWAKNGDSHPIIFKYETNTVADSVRRWYYVNGTPITTDCYPPASLSKSIVVDELGNQTIEYKTMNDVVVCKRVQTDKAPLSAHIGWHSTYFIYDAMSRMICVIPPAAIAIISSNWNFDSIRSGYCYQMRYDGRSRLITRYMPGADSIEMVYDQKDRPVMLRDGNMRQDGKWLATFYDDSRRPVKLAFYASNQTREAMQTSINNNGMKQITQSFTAPAIADLVVATHDRLLYEAKNSVELIAGFDSNNDEIVVQVNPSLSGQTTTVTVNSILPGMAESDLTPIAFYFYDNYNFSGKQDVSVADLQRPYPDESNFPERTLGATTIVRGLATGTKVRVLGTDKWLTTTNYYNEKGNVIQTITENLSGGKEISTTLYSFDGKVLSVYRRHINQQGTMIPNVNIETRFTYDHAGRTLTIKKLVNDNATPERIIAAYTYDELGNVTGKELGRKGNEAPLEIMTFDYNIHGAIQNINKAYLNGDVNGMHFAQSISYDDVFEKIAYNQNISGLRWKGWNDKTKRAYGYSYDRRERLTNAEFSEESGGSWNKSVRDFSTDWITYDANGNITAMANHGQLGTSSTFIDRLAYRYASNSNQLVSVYDSTNITERLGDFKNSPTNDIDYKYDKVGNLTMDLNKGISSIHYNHLFLPDEVVFTGNKGRISFLYDAAGNLLQKRILDQTTGVDKVTKIDFMNGFIYKNDTLQTVTHEEGRIRFLLKPGSSPRYVFDYFIKDYQGNTRIVLADSTSQSVYYASMEAPKAATEAALFSNIEQTRVATPAGYPQYAELEENKAVAKLNAQNESGKIGPSLVLRVVAGDTVRIKTKAFYKSQGPKENGNNDLLLKNILPGAVKTLAGNKTGTTGHGGRNDFIQPFGNSVFDDQYNSLRRKDPAGQKEDHQRPRAYLNYVLFDDNFKMVEGNSGVKQVSAASDELQVLSSDNIVTTKSGFLYVFTSNETAQDVYFDDLLVVQSESPVVEETHYYPYGLTMYGISNSPFSATTYPVNNFKYNAGSMLHSRELADGTGLDWYSTPMRTLDPQIGRWLQLDSKPDFSVSPYTAMGGNPIKNTDPRGDTLEGVNERSANRLLQIINSSLKKSGALAALFKLSPDQVTFQHINTQDFLNAAASASADELALGLAYFAAVNTGTRHVVSIIKGNEDPTEYDLKNVKKGKSNRAVYEDNTGGGTNNNEWGPNATFTLMVMDPKKSTDFRTADGKYFEAKPTVEELLAHEVLGHGYFLHGYESPDYDSQLAIVMGNIARKAVGEQGYRTGTDHGILYGLQLDEATALPETYRIVAQSLLNISYYNNLPYGVKVHSSIKNDVKKR
ncbi:DUF6443 domain-containing protein [Chitinophaga sp. Hz27]|uniref:DUF6443 domain-containing protein n=1 Tax=Chitinophaga sp. Hz27 TaxID=3347169 RepID=UPI0035D94A16